MKQRGKNNIRSLTSDITPDSWVTFYLFYFNQGLGSDASFQHGNNLIHIFYSNLVSEKNSETIIEAVDKKHEMAVGEFTHILTQLSDEDLDQLKANVGVALIMETKSGVNLF